MSETHLHYCMLVVLADLLEFGILSYWNLYWINSDYLLLAISTLLSLYEFFPSTTVMGLRQFACSLNQGLCLTSQLASALGSLALKGPLMCPLLLLAICGNSV